MNPFGGRRRALPLTSTGFGAHVATMNKQTLVYYPIDELVLWEDNYRRGSLASITASVRRFGFNGALRIWKGTVMAGNHLLQSLLAMRDAGELAPHGIQVKNGQWLAPTLDVSHLSEDEAKAFAIADNRASDLAENDEAMLAVLLKSLEHDPELVDAMSFSLRELREIIDVPAAEPIDAPEPEDPEALDFGDVRVVEGDVWILGDHRLMCGDSTDQAQVGRLMAGKKASLFATDPPYLVDYTGDDRPSQGKDWSGVYKEQEIEDPEAFMDAVLASALSVTKPNTPFYMWHAERRIQLLLAAWEKAGLLWHQNIIWVKPTAAMTYAIHHYKHEPCMFGWRTGNKPPLDGIESTKSKTVWEVDWEGKARLAGNQHPTQKPVELFARPMRLHTKRGEVCLELFSGSGSQILAAEQEGRRCFAMELAPEFCEVAIRRWEKATGKTAVKEEPGA